MLPSISGRTDHILVKSKSFATALPLRFLSQPSGPSPLLRPQGPWPTRTLVRRKAESTVEGDPGAVGGHTLRVVIMEPILLLPDRALGIVQHCELRIKKSTLKWIPMGSLLTELYQSQSIKYELPYFGVAWIHPSLAMQAVIKYSSIQNK